MENAPAATTTWCKDDPANGEHLWRRLGVQDRDGRLVVVSRCDDCGRERVRRWRP